MTGLRVLAVLFAAAAVALTGCDTASDDPAGRERVVNMVKAGQLPPGEGFETLALPGELDHVSTGGEVVGLHQGNAWVVRLLPIPGSEPLHRLGVLGAPTHRGPPREPALQGNATWPELVRGGRRVACLGALALTVRLGGRIAW